MCNMSSVNERLRIPLADEYALALGRATYCFASCEWIVVWCWERLAANALHDATSGGRRGKGLTAGQIADQFAKAVDEATDAPERESLRQRAAEFKDLVEVRNSLLHGKPHTSDEGWQGLHGRGHGSWSIADINAAADRFAACTIALNDRTTARSSSTTPNGNFALLAPPTD